MTIVLVLLVSWCVVGLLAAAVFGGAASSSGRAPHRGDDE